MAIKEFLFGLIPDFNTLPGFLFYTLLVYGVILLMGWLAAPTLEESYQEELRKSTVAKKGKAMRDKNKNKDENKES